eukprot:5309511-Alexandrium_andersonii.AAC.1
MSASLVGSEMCIRDRPLSELRLGLLRLKPPSVAHVRRGVARFCSSGNGCLLYTSDAADDM